ncbi:MAG TPA: hypothetical protein VF335_09110, partial [Chitinivibrionales bacterium]
MSFLSNIRQTLKIAQPADELTIVDAEDDGISESAHYKIKQRFHGITVLGAEATVHLHGEQADFVGRTIATPAISTVPVITSDMALERALADLRDNNVVIRDLSAEDRLLLGYAKPTTELVLFPSTKPGFPARLAYQVLARPNVIDWWEFVIDAENGDILLKYNRT